jgi:hypothetical protein
MKEDLVIEVSILVDTLPIPVNESFLICLRIKFLETGKLAVFAVKFYMA